MLFWWFWSPFSENGSKMPDLSKVFIRFFATRFCMSKNVEFHRFYKAFRRSGKVSRKRSLRNAFLMIWEPFFREWLENDQFAQGFIRVFTSRLCISENVEFDRFYKVFRRFGNALRKPSLGNAFLIISGSFFKNGTKKSSFSTGFIRVWAWVDHHVRFIYKPNAFWSFWRPLFSHWGHFFRNPKGTPCGLQKCV